MMSSEIRCIENKGLMRFSMLCLAVFDLFYEFLATKNVLVFPAIQEYNARIMVQFVNVKTRKWCVYLHYAGEEVFYVGSGRCGRPFDMQSRNNTWRKIVRGLESLDVVIVEWFATQEAATNFEYKLIDKLSPRANIHTRGRIISRRQKEKLNKEISTVKELRLSMSYSDIKSHLRPSRFQTALVYRLCRLADKEIKQST